MIPYKINENKKINLSVRIIINSLKFRNEKKLSNRLLNELIDIYNNRGISIKKRIEICKDIKLNSPNLRFLK
jgi:ribosomal protein S7